MKKLIVSINTTLDGYIATVNGGLDWHFPYWSDEMAAHSLEQLRGMDTILLGRFTYEKMAAYWPHAHFDEYSGMMNNYTKIVFSRSLAKPSWHHTRVIAGDISGEVHRLKQQPGQDIVIYGSCSIVQLLLEMHLIDEYRLWIHPVAINEGRALFRQQEDIRKLKLLKTTPFLSGVILCHYQPR